MTRAFRTPPRMFSRGVVTAFIVAAFGPALLSQTLDRSRAEALARRAADRLQALQQEADALASQERSLIGDLRKLEIDRQLQAEQLRQVTTESQQVAAELTANAQRMQDLERQESSGRPEL